MGLNRRQIAQRKRQAINKIKRELGAKYHPEIHDPVQGSALFYLEWLKWVESVNVNERYVKMDVKPVLYIIYEN